MSGSFVIQRVAVLGAGVMGAQIAAHCINSGIKTLLFDLSSAGENRNQLIEKAMVGLTKLKPAPLGNKADVSLLTACNYDDDLKLLQDCDLIIEAIAERVDWKKSLYQKITPYLSERAFLVSNTSGLSINRLSDILPVSLRPRFCGVHFFNPPRYMHLVELIPSYHTNLAKLDDLETWLTRYLGKGVVRAKDTPNFIANRIGVFSLLATMHHAKRFNLGWDTVDALTGSLLGRPKSATCRTMDVVGLDTMAHVVHTMAEQLTNDPWNDLFTLPDWLLKHIEEGHLGQKTGQGIYRKQGKVIQVYDVEKDSYRDSSHTISSEIKSIMAITPPQEKYQQLMGSKDPQAQFIIACLHDLFRYCAYHLETIAHSVRDIDLAMRWGFGWSEGPFELWQSMGMHQITSLLETVSSDSSGATLPVWLKNIDAFYSEDGAFSPTNNAYVTANELPVYQRQILSNHLSGVTSSRTHVCFENDAVRLWELTDEIPVVEFKTKGNTIGQSVLDSLQEVLGIVESKYGGLIIHQRNPLSFSSGANLVEIATLLKEEKFDDIEDMLKEFQSVLMRIKYSSFPVIAALRGRALGGGCELLMHCDGVVSAYESYPGLVEAGVGLIPAGGGCKEMAIRAAQHSNGKNLMSYVQAYFEQIATARVASSAPEAKQLAYLREHDDIIMHAEEVLFIASKKIQYLLDANYQAPLPASFPIVGREGHAQLEAILVNWKEGRFMSSHDYMLATHLAKVLCGGDLPQGTVVNEDWLLKLEREAFLTLARTDETQARIEAILTTGKPLRN